MKTTKPISTISYNSPGYLVLRLKELLKARKIEFFAYILHKGEDDEAGKKEHIHLYVEPACSIQTADLADFFVEPVPGSELPLRCMPFRSSKFPDWYLYCLHDLQYLQSKGLTKKFHYTDSDFVTNDSQFFTCLVRSIDWLAVSPARAVLDAVAQGYTKEEFLISGRFPITQTTAYSYLFDAAQAYFKSEMNSRGIDENGEIKPKN